MKNSLIFFTFLIFSNIVLNDQIRCQNQFNDFPNLINDSTRFQALQNEFNRIDESYLLGYNNFESSFINNFGSPKFNFLFKPDSQIYLNSIFRINSLNYYEHNNYYLNFPFSKISYSQAYNEGQRLKIIHVKRHRYGSLSFDYDRLVSFGYLLNNLNRNRNFGLNFNLFHPNFPYSIEIKIQSSNLNSNLNGGLSNSQNFLSSSSENWELFPTKYNYITFNQKKNKVQINNKFKLSKSKFIDYEISLTNDSIMLNNLEEDTLFYPIRLDSINNAVILNKNFTHRLDFIKINKKNKIKISMSHQLFQFNEDRINNLVTKFQYISSRFNNEFDFSLSRLFNYDYQYQTNFFQNFNFFSFKSYLNIGISKLLPNLNFNLYSSNFDIFDRLLINKFLKFGLKTKNLNFKSNFYKLSNFVFLDSHAVPNLFKNKINVFQNTLEICLKKNNFHFLNKIIYQYSNRKFLSYPNLMFNSNIYWHGLIFNKNTESQIGINTIFRGEFNGFEYSPIIGEFYFNQNINTASSLRTDIYLNIKVKTLKMYLIYENITYHLLGNQFILSNYPMIRPNLRLSVIWNFYD